MIENIPKLKTYPVTVLLVDDQEIIAEAVRMVLDGQQDIAFHYCKDPAQAIKQAKELRPTVILQDLVMPDIDGLTLLKHYKKDPATQNVPVIILSVTEEPAVKAEAFALGASDYIVKLPNDIELLARIRHHSEAYIHLLERNDVYEKLVENQKIINTDLRNAASYVTALLPLQLKGEITTTWRFIPSAQLGGDVFGYHWLDADHFALYLLDVCGHGVGAALLSITIANVIRSQSLVGTDFKDPANVLASLNETFPMEKHNQMFFTIWYGVYNKKTRVLNYSSGGHPPALLYTLDDDKEFKPQTLRTDGLVIGAIPKAVYNNASIEIPKDNRFFLYSDGVYELFNDKKELLPLEDFMNGLNRYANSPKNDLGQIVKTAQLLQGGKETFMDDFSIVEFNF
jgi:phosphoserine phosphatase RsbU/P